jgi:hypothetical protein
MAASRWNESGGGNGSTNTVHGAEGDDWQGRTPIVWSPGLGPAQLPRPSLRGRARQCRPDGWNG